MAFPIGFAWWPTRRIDVSAGHPRGRLCPNFGSNGSWLGVHIGHGPTLISTVLGSCVSACLWDAETAIGGMNHFLLPVGSQATETLDPKYGVYAMERLINGLMGAGADRRRLKAKVFGRTFGGSWRPRSTT